MLHVIWLNEVEVCQAIATSIVWNPFSIWSLLKLRSKIMTSSFQKLGPRALWIPIRPALKQIIKFQVSLFIRPLDFLWCVQHWRSWGHLHAHPPQVLGPAPLQPNSQGILAPHQRESRGGCLIAELRGEGEVRGSPPPKVQTIPAPVAEAQSTPTKAPGLLLVNSHGPRARTGWRWRWGWARRALAWRACAGTSINARERWGAAEAPGVCALHAGTAPGWSSRSPVAAEPSPCPTPPPAPKAQKHRRAHCS